MKKGIITLLVSCVIIASLLLASCGTTETETTTATQTATTTKTTTTTTAMTTTSATTTATGSDLVTITLTKLDGTTVTKQVEEPQYGGTLNIIKQAGDNLGWDPAVLPMPTLTGIGIVMEELAEGDWTRTTNGTGEISGTNAISEPAPEFTSGILAESWEQVDPTTLVIKIKEGMHWWDKAPVNGREIIADDIIYCLERYKNHPAFDKRYVQYLDTLTATDDHTIQITLTNPVAIALQGILVSRGLYMYPPELIEQGLDLSDWHNVVGSGPFIPDDLVEGSIYRFKRNENYHMNDPYFPENQLPYIDKLNAYILLDTSAQQSALRTGKVDILNDVVWQDADSLRQTNPELLYFGVPGWRPLCSAEFLTHPGLPPEADSDSPFYDIKVRKALAMAINRDEIVEGYLKGNGVVYNWPFLKTDPANYVPMEDLPADVAEQFEYNPEKAKALLAEAGYANASFEATLNSQAPGLQERAELLASYWASVDVMVSFNPLDTSTWQATWENKELTGLIMDASGASGTAKAISNFTTGAHANSGFSDPILDALYNEAAALSDPAAAAAKYKEAGIQLLSNVWVVQFPAEMTYGLWSPRVKNYAGVSTLQMLTFGGPLRYVWLGD